MNKLSFFLFLSLLFCLNTGIFGQVALDSLSREFIAIDSIKLTGNEKTKDYILLRELTFEVGDTVSIGELEFSRDRINSMKLFYSVKFILRGEGIHRDLEIAVKESWYIFPVPFLKLQSNKISRSNIGGTLNWMNFTGRNDRLNIFAVFGYDPSYGISYSTPMINSELNMSLSGSVSRHKISNKSKTAIKMAGEDFNYTTYDFIVGMGSRINIYNEYYFNLGFRYIESPFAAQGITASGEKIDRTLWFRANYSFDSRDFKLFAKKGFLIFGSVMWLGFGMDNYNYGIASFDVRNYKNIWGDLVGRWRLVTRNTFGYNVPFYDYSYLGFRDYIRGNKNKEREGRHSALASIEFSYPLLKSWEFSVKLPLLPQSLTSVNVSVQLNIFADTGLTYDNGERIDLKKFDSGYGFGIVILFVPYNAVRFEYAFNEFGRGEFLFGTGFSF
ncbi:MAG: hypothetical protein GXO87_13895 [Chlorobi bacterium]|nr:hypothetical protein [Chlorobiota bacterium]